jgi:REP element-mobilizing transposase RayT
MKQLFFNFINDYKKEFGGCLLEGKRKSQRPLSTKHPIHLVLQSDHKGLFSPTNLSLHELIRKQAKKFGIKIYDLALNWNHIHCVIKINSRDDYKRFIRSLTSILTAKIKAARKDIEEVFTLRSFTRIISWGRDFKNVLNYQVLNQLEAMGFISRKKIPQSSSKFAKRKKTRR